MKRFFKHVMSAGLLLVFTGCVMPEDVALLENRVASLEKDNMRRTQKEQEYDVRLSRGLENVEADLANLSETGKSQQVRFAELKNDINLLQNRYRELAGKLDETQHRLSMYSENAFEDEKRQLQRLDDAVSRNFQRIVSLEQYMGFEPTAGPAVEATGGQGTQPAIETEQGMYEHAKSLLDQGKNDEARAKFEAFLKQYPDSQNADNATFWIADSYYKDQWYEKAILEYQKVIEKYADGNKVPAALLKQGYAFANLGEKANARLILKELVKRYPGSHEATLANAKLGNL